MTSRWQPVRTEADHAGTAHALAAALGGYVVETLDNGGPVIVVPTATDRVHVVSCRPTGSVQVNGVEIGVFSQGTDALAEAFWAFVGTAVA